jgi:hypothetical protein
MQTVQHKQLTKVLLNMQAMLEDADLGEHVAIQNAFNALVCAIDDEYYKDTNALYKDLVA